MRAPRSRPYTRKQSGTGAATPYITGKKKGKGKENEKEKEKESRVEESAHRWRVDTPTIDTSLTHTDILDFDGMASRSLRT